MGKLETKIPPIGTNTKKLLSMLLLFMLWVYFSWVLVLFGASVSFCLHQKEG
jgi:uncharacterized BrkB/YihY/UPF0761 family membrane protein